MNTPYNTNSRASVSNDPVGGLILLYHRVANLATDPQLLAVSPDHFREHLKLLRSEFNPIALSTMVDCILAGRVPDRSVAVTFDDGYTDNHEIAAPLLRAFDIPATIFVTPRTGDIGREFWWDDLERIILRTPHLPDRCTLDLPDSRHEWTLPKADADGTNGDTWSVMDDAPPAPHQAFYLHLCRLLRVIPEQSRLQVLDELCRWARISSTGRPTHISMTPAELRAISHDGLIEIGAHTLTHPVLSSLGVADQFAEIIGSRQRLEYILGRSIKGFSYPYGCRSDFGRETMAMTRNAGFQYACANTGKPPHPSGRVTAACDIYCLPRVLVRNWDAETFGRYMRNSMHVHDAWEVARHVGVTA